MEESTRMPHYELPIVSVKMKLSIVFVTIFIVFAACGNAEEGEYIHIELNEFTI